MPTCKLSAALAAADEVDVVYDEVGRDDTVVATAFQWDTKPAPLLTIMTWDSIKGHKVWRLREQDTELYDDIDTNVWLADGGLVGLRFKKRDVRPLRLTDL